MTKQKLEHKERYFMCKIRKVKGILTKNNFFINQTVV